MSFFTDRLHEAFEDSASTWRGVIIELSREKLTKDQVLDALELLAKHQPPFWEKIHSGLFGLARNREESMVS